MNGAPDDVGWLRFARDGSLLAANVAAARLFGLRHPGELMALAARRPLIPAMRPERFAGCTEPMCIEMECCHEDGGTWISRLAIVPRRGESGELVEVDALLLEDAAGRAESETQRTRTLLDSVLNGLPNPVFVKDEQHRWVILNESCCRFLGYPCEQLLGKSDRDFFPQEEADVFWAKDDLVFADGGTNENEERITDAAGRTHVILTRKTLHTEPSGRHLLLGVITDISERKHMEEELARSHDELDRRVAERTAALCEANRRLTLDIAERQRVEQSLRESEERSRHLADAMPQIVWTCQADGAVEGFNVKWSEYTGLPQCVGTGWDWQEQVHPSDLPPYLDLVRRSVASGSAFEAELRLRRYNGIYRWHLFRALPIRSEVGAVIRWFGTATDIEEQKRRQEVLRDEDRRKNEFLALLGHELRNPLNPIRLAVSLMRREGTDAATMRRAQEIIDRQVVHMARLIDDLLDISRIAHNKILLRPERVDLVQLVRAALGDRWESLAAHGLLLQASLPSSPIPVDADPTRMAQAVGNLLDNAEKFTDPGGKVTVSVTRDPDGTGVSITVRDTGVGMSDETLAGLFKPFVQAERSVPRGRGGLGLGLSVVQGLVVLHHGTICASSDGEGCGSTFTIRLPLLKSEIQAPAVMPLVASSARSHRIIVIEDNRDAAEALDLALSAAGHEVTVATTGEEGIAQARRLRPRVVLSDIGLPGISGYDVARSVREDRALASIHLVAITGYGQEADQRKALCAGFDRHLTKPFDIEALARILADLP